VSAHEFVEYPHDRTDHIDVDHQQDIPASWTLAFDVVDDPDDRQRWSTWLAVERGSRGPEPRPQWVVTDEAAIDTELGILKTGKEADVFLLERGVPGDDDRSVVMAAKRYRTEEHRSFHRSAVYTEGRRTRRSRDARAMAKKTSYGRSVAAGALSRADADTHLAVLARADAELATTWRPWAARFAGLVLSSPGAARRSG